MIAKLGKEQIFQIGKVCVLHTISQRLRFSRSSTPQPSFYWIFLDHRSKYNSASKCMHRFLHNNQGVCFGLQKCKENFQNAMYIFRIFRS